MKKLTKKKKEPPKKQIYTTSEEIYDERMRVRKQIISLEEKYIFLNNIYNNFHYEYIPFSKEELFENMVKINQLTMITKKIESPDYLDTTNAKELLNDFAKFLNYKNGFIGSVNEESINDYLKEVERKRAENGSKLVQK